MLQVMPRAYKLACVCVQSLRKFIGDAAVQFGACMKQKSILLVTTLPCVNGISFGLTCCSTIHIRIRICIAKSAKPS